METPTIVHVIVSLGRGGCENFLLKTLPRLKYGRHIVLTFKQGGEMEEEFRQWGIKIASLKLTQPVSLLAPIRLVKALRKIRPNLVITYLAHADFYARLAQPLISSPVVPFLRAVPSHPRMWPIRLFERLTKYFVRRYLANSPAIRDYYQEHFGVSDTKFTIIPNGVDTTIYYPTDEKTRINLRERLNIPTTDVVFIYVANLHDYKGHRYLLEAFNKVWAEAPNCSLLLVGDGPLGSELKQQAASYPSEKKIFFLGKRKDVPELLRAADIFVFPTLQEGMSNALLEAMASGLAIVASDIPENRSVFSEAVFVTPKDVPALAAAMAGIVKDAAPRHRIAQAARAESIKSYNLEEVAAKLGGVLKKLTSV